MPATWGSVASNPEYQALPDDQKAAARAQYFDSVVAPNVPQEHLQDARKQFDEASSQKMSTPIGQSLEDQVREANEKMGFLENLGAGMTNLVKGDIGHTALGRGAERGVLGMAQFAPGLISSLTGEAPEQTTQDMVDIAKRTRMEGEGTGISGAIGEGILDPRYAALLASGPMGWMARGATGAGIGFANPVETTDKDQALKDRLGNSATNAAGFIAIPPLMNGAAYIGGKLAPLLADESSVGGQAAANSIPSVYKQIASILAGEGNTPNRVVGAGLDMKSAQRAVEAGGSTEIPRTLPEVLGSDNLLKRQSLLSQMGNQAGSDITKFNEKRLGEILPEAKQTLVEIAADGSPSTLTDAGSSIKEAAALALQKSREELRGIGSGYQDLLTNELPQDKLLELRSNPLIEDTYQSVLKNPSLMGRKYKFGQVIPDELKGLSPTAQKSAMEQLSQSGESAGKVHLKKTLEGGFTDTSFHALKQTKEQLDALAREQYNKFGRSSPDGKAFTEAATTVRDFLNSSEDKYAQLNKTYATTRKGVVDLENSAIGKLATAKTPEMAAKTFMNLSREQLQDVVPKLQQIDPESVQEMGGAMMRELTDQTSGKGLAAYINAMSGENIGSLERNAITQDRMKAVLGDDAFEGQQKLVSTLKDIIKGLPKGSDTSAKQQLRDEMSGGRLASAANALIQTIAHPKTSTIHGAKWLVNRYQNGLTNAHQEELMKIFLNPDLSILGRAMENATAIKKKNIALQYIGEQLSGAATSKINQSGAVDISPVGETKADDLTPSQQKTKDAFYDQINSRKTPTRMTITPEDKKPAPKLELPKKPESGVNVPKSFRQAEGFRDKTYRDTTGNRTVGVGFNMDSGIAQNVWDAAGIKKDFNAVRNGKQKITEIEAQKLLQKSYEIAKNDAKSLINDFDTLPKNRQEAVVHLSYQYGKPRLKEALPGVLASINQGNYKAAAGRLLASDYAKKYKRRAQALARMLHDNAEYREA